MLTLITGTPGAGKSLYAVWNFARKVPGSTIEQDGAAVPRRLLSNIKDLLVEHVHIDAKDLDSWHTWAQPGDVILFDEVQEVWRPRGLGTKVPDCIAKLETHRHMGVDLVLISQHPMLLDPNIRRLVNQHIHMRRLAGKLVMYYEWDHCSNPSATKSCLHSGTFWHPKEAYGLYKSAQLHTKPTTRIPKVAYLGLLAIAGLAYAGPHAYERLTGSLGDRKEQEQAQKPGVKTTTTVTQGPPPGMVLPTAPEGQQATEAVTVAQEPPKPVAAGCVASPVRCDCFAANGAPVEKDEAMCEALTGPKSAAVPGVLRSEVSGYVPPPSPGGLHF